MPLSKQQEQCIERAAEVRRIARLKAAQDAIPAILTDIERSSIAAFSAEIGAFEYKKCMDNLPPLTTPPVAARPAAPAASK